MVLKNGSDTYCTSGVSRRVRKSAEFLFYVEGISSSERLVPIQVTFGNPEIMC